MDPNIPECLDINKVFLLGTLDEEEKNMFNHKLKKISDGKELPCGIYMPSAGIELLKLYEKQEKKCKIKAEKGKL